MEKFKLVDGETIDLNYEMKSPSLYTGSIMEKCSKKKTTKPALSTEGRSSKTDDLKTFLAYLLNNENFCNWMMREFFLKLKPVIDTGFGFINEN